MHPHATYWKASLSATRPNVAPPPFLHAPVCISKRDARTSTSRYEIENPVCKGELRAVMEWRWEGGGASRRSIRVRPRPMHMLCSSQPASTPENPSTYRRRGQSMEDTGCAYCGNLPETNSKGNKRHGIRGYFWDESRQEGMYLCNRHGHPDTVRKGNNIIGRGDDPYVESGFWDWNARDGTQFHANNGEGLQQKMDRLGSIVEKLRQDDPMVMEDLVEATDILARVTRGPVRSFRVTTIPEAVSKSEDMVDPVLNQLDQLIEDKFEDNPQEDHIEFIDGLKNGRDDCRIALEDFRSLH